MHLGGVVVQVVAGGDLARALAQEGQQEGDQHHDKGVELGQPGHDDGGEAAAAGGVGGDGVVGAGHRRVKPARPQMAPEMTMVRMMTPWSR